MTPASKLDKVLKFLASDYPEKKNFPFENIFTLLDETGITINEIFFIMEKLEGDGYVKIEKTPERSPQPILFTTVIENYSITYLGAFFILNENGYTGANFKRASEAIRIERIEKEQRINRKQLFWLTLAIAIGTLIQAYYYLVKL